VSILQKGKDGEGQLATSALDRFHRVYLGASWVGVPGPNFIEGSRNSRGDLLEAAWQRDGLRECWKEGKHRKAKRNGNGRGKRSPNEPGGVTAQVRCRVKGKNVGCDSNGERASATGRTAGEKKGSDKEPCFVQMRGAI